VVGTHCWYLAATARFTVCETLLH